MHCWYLADLHLRLDLMTPLLHHLLKSSAAPSLQVEHASVCSSNQHAVLLNFVMSGVIVGIHTVPAGSKSSSCMLRFRLRDLFPESLSSSLSSSLF